MKVSSPEPSEEFKRALKLQSAAKRSPSAIRSNTHQPGSLRQEVRSRESASVAVRSFEGSWPHPNRQRAALRQHDAYRGLGRSAFGAARTPARSCHPA